MPENFDELALYYHEQLPDQLREYLRSRGLSDVVAILAVETRAVAPKTPRTPI